MKYCRPLPPQRLHLRRPDLVPGHGPGAARDVREGDQGLAVGQGGRAGEGGLQDQRPVRRHARARASSASRSSTATSRRRRSTISTRRPSRDEPFFMNVNFMKVHQPNMPHPDYVHKSLSKSKYADSVVELDARIGAHHGQGPRARPRQEHAGLLHDRQRRLAGRLPRRRLHAVPRHQGHRPRGRQPRAGDRLDAGQDQGRARRTTTSSAAST